MFAFKVNEGAEYCRDSLAKLAEAEFTDRCGISSEAGRDDQLIMRGRGAMKSRDFNVAALEVEDAVAAVRREDKTDNSGISARLLRMSSAEQKVTLAVAFLLNHDSAWDNHVLTGSLDNKSENEVGTPA